MKTNRERKIFITKVDGYHQNKNNCAVEIQLSLSADNCFSACASLYNHVHTDIIMGGQCFDTLISEFPELKNSDIFMECYSLWKSYHLNDLHAGTSEQENALKDAVQNGILTRYGANNYQETCDYLKSINLYEVELNGKSYKYGTGWLKEEIPRDDLLRIESLIDTGEILQNSNEIELE